MTGAAATYLLDSDVFMDAKNHYYGIDFCPAFWDWLIANNKKGRVFSIEKVNAEIQAGSDDLSTWAAARGSGFFLAPDEAMLSTLGQVSLWAKDHTWGNKQRYSPAAVTTFLQGADYYLVAYALAHKHILVTREIAAPTVNTIKIPNACIGLGITHMNPFEMLRRERARFVLGERA